MGKQLKEIDLVLKTGNLKNILKVISVFYAFQSWRYKLSMFEYNSLFMSNYSF